jgi:hypothetical protein
VTNLSTYIAGGAIFALAMDWAGVSIGTQFSRASMTGIDLTPSAVTVVDRSGKGDRLQMADAPMVEHVIRTTVVAKNAFPSDVNRAAANVAMGKSDRAIGPSVPMTPGTQTSSSSRNPSPVLRTHAIPEGCDPAFSPLVGGKHNYAARCLS